MTSSKTRDFSGIKTENLETMLSSGSSVYTKEELESIRSELAQRQVNLSGTEEKGEIKVELTPEEEELQKKGKAFFGFKGRLNRLRYFLYSIILGHVMGVIPGAIIVAFWSSTSFFIAGLIFVLFSIVGYTSSIKRFHDLDKSGWWTLLFLVPFVNIAAGLYILFKKGTEGPNRFGPDPLAMA